MNAIVHQLLNLPNNKFAKTELLFRIEFLTRPLLPVQLAESSPFHSFFSQNVLARQMPVL